MPRPELDPYIGIWIQLLGLLQKSLIVVVSILGRLRTVHNAAQSYQLVYTDLFGPRSSPALGGYQYKRPAETVMTGVSTSGHKHGGAILIRTRAGGSGVAHIPIGAVNARQHTG